MPLLGVVEQVASAEDLGVILGERHLGGMYRDPFAGEWEVARAELARGEQVPAALCWES